jgi:uncharacterized membrane protein (DUF485 family)
MADTTTPEDARALRARARATLSALRRKLEFGDVLIFLYLTVFFRQYFWILHNDKLAWRLTILSTALAWGAHMYAKEETPPEERTPRIFWPLVALPLVLVYALRVAFPDLSFDVLNHRLIQSERALHGALLIPGDFFPTIFPFNPASDMLTGITRVWLGYRLGTIINLLALVWAGTVLNKILRPHVERAWLRSSGVLSVLFTEHILFELNNYMVDVLTLPLLLEATRRALRLADDGRAGRDLIYTALLLGACVALKLTNVAMVAPIVALCAYQLFAQSSRPVVNAKSLRFDAKFLSRLLLAALAFLWPLVPHAVYIYRETGSPVFPLYNKIFRSPYWPLVNVYDGRWGAKGFAETLLWPLLLPFRAERLSELAVYSGRISFGVVAAALCLLLPRADRRVRLLAGVALSGAILWSATSGYIRYALYLELLGGVLVLYLARWLAARMSQRPRVMRTAVASVIVCVLVVQNVLAGVYVSRTEWSRRKTYFERPEDYVSETQYFMHDHTLRKFLPPDKRGLIDGVEAWIVSNVKTNGLEVLFKRDVPMLSVHNLEYFDAPEANRRFARALGDVSGKRMFSLCLTDDLEPSLEFIRRRGLGVGRIERINLPFYSAYTHINTALVEVLPPERAATNAAEFAATQTAAALPAGAYRARLSVKSPPPTLRAGQQETIYVVVKNASAHAWPARGTDDGKYFVTVGNIWLAGGTGALVNNMDGRTRLVQDLAPAAETEVPLRITAPEAAGAYVLELDVVQEGVTWFKDKGSETLKIRIRVE